MNQSEIDDAFNELPRWEQNLMRKHEEQIAHHQRQFGKFGELQKSEHKKALKKEAERLEASLSDEEKQRLERALAEKK